MTATTETAGTALVQVAPGLIARVESGEQINVADLANLLATPDRVFPSDGALPKAADKIKVTDKLKASLKRLPQVFGKVQPTEPRILEAAELVELTDEAVTIQSLSADLGKRLKAVKETIRNHMDAVAEKNGDAAGAARVADGEAQGHFLLGRPETPYKVEVEGYEDAWQQRYVKGASAPSFEKLLELFEQGKIDRAEFLAFSRSVRVLDLNKAAEHIRRYPGRGLEILGAITTKGAPSASLYAPKK